MSKWWICTLLIVCGMQPSEGRLKLVHDVVLHGAAEAQQNLPFFPNITWTHPGELTAIGERQLCLLGRLRREQYLALEPLLPLMHDPSTMYVRSAGLRRSHQSAQAYLVCMYPTGQEPLSQSQRSNASRLLPPLNLHISSDIIEELGDAGVPYGLPLISIASVQENTETLLYPGDCPLVQKNEEAYFKSHQYAKLIQETYNAAWQDVMQSYPTITLEYLLNNDNAFMLAEFINAADRDGRRPAKLAQNISAIMRQFIHDVEKGQQSRIELIHKLAMADLVQEVVGRMNDSIRGNTRIRYVLYSGYRSTQTTLLLALQKLNSSIVVSAPDYASNLLFELSGPPDSKQPESYYVTVYQDGRLVHNESYIPFSRAFVALGQVDGPRKEACQLNPDVQLLEENFRERRMLATCYPDSVY